MQPLKKPPWLKKRIPPMEDLEKVKSVLREGALHTVCEEARCPNLGECFSKGTATFLILNSVCTRHCGFCAVEHGTPLPPDESEPERVAEAVERMRLRYVVVTSVTRDDLPDGGASQFAKTIRAIRARDRTLRIETLVPDFKGDSQCLEVVLSESPDVLNHNVETVPRLYAEVRPQADYRRSLNLLKQAKKRDPRLVTKSGFMLGVGEEAKEIFDLLCDLRDVGCDLVTIGQYLQPRSDRIPVRRYVPPKEFEEYKRMGEAMGFKEVASGPFVRSSFHASEMFESALETQLP
jgi:lipoic acid synthetase